VGQILDTLFSFFFNFNFNLGCSSKFKLPSASALSFPFYLISKILSYKFEFLAFSLISSFPFTLESQKRVSLSCNVDSTLASFVFTFSPIQKFDNQNLFYYNKRATMKECVDVLGCGVK